MNFLYFDVCNIRNVWAINTDAHVLNDVSTLKLDNSFVYVLHAEVSTYFFATKNHEM